MPKYFSAKDERMVKHIKDSGAPDSVAFATVNKYRAKHGLTKKAKRRRRG